MKIHTFKPEEYRGCPIYFRNFHKTFEYLLVFKKQIYASHLSVKPTFINKLLYWLGVEKSYYSDFQTGKILFQIRKMAEATIDFLRDKNTNKYDGPNAQSNTGEVKPDPGKSGS